MKNYQYLVKFAWAEACPHAGQSPAEDAVASGIVKIVHEALSFSKDRAVETDMRMHAWRITLVLLNTQTVIRAGSGTA
eukprot:scaffold56627_cov17-Prasinocladus_malaysianus.AAC.1